MFKKEKDLLWYNHFEFFVCSKKMRRGKNCYEKFFSIEENSNLTIDSAMNLELLIAKDSKTQLEGINSSIIINRFKLEGRLKNDLFFSIKSSKYYFKNLKILKFKVVSIRSKTISPF